MTLRLGSPLVTRSFSRAQNLQDLFSASALDLTKYYCLLNFGLNSGIVAKVSINVNTRTMLSSDPILPFKWELCLVTQRFLLGTFLEGTFLMKNKNKKEMLTKNVGNEFINLGTLNLEETNVDAQHIQENAGKLAALLKPLPCKKVCLEFTNTPCQNTSFHRGSSKFHLRGAVYKNLRTTKLKCSTKVCYIRRSFNKLRC